MTPDVTADETVEAYAPLPCNGCGARWSCICPAEVVEAPAPDPVEALRLEYAAVAKGLWRELARHQAVHGCNTATFTCDLDLLLTNAWCRAREMSFAIDWLLGKAEMQFGSAGFPYENWAYDFYAGPWPTLADGTVVR